MNLTGKPKIYRVTWRWNRSHTLVLGQTQIDFAPNGSQIMDAAMVNHPEFRNQKDDFVVQEVSNA